METSKCENNYQELVHRLVEGAPFKLNQFVALDKIAEEAFPVSLPQEETGNIWRIYTIFGPIVFDATVPVLTLWYWAMISEKYALLLKQHILRQGWKQPKNRPFHATLEKFTLVNNNLYFIQIIICIYNHLYFILIQLTLHFFWLTFKQSIKKEF